MKLNEIQGQIHRLDAHTNIALDFDETLVHHPKSELLQQYVVDNYQRKNFYIVTFRSHGQERFIFHPIHKMLCTKDMFKGVANISDSFFEKFTAIETLRALGRYSGPLVQDEINYTEWKALACKELDCTVIVDDRVAQVQAGCIKYGIEFIDTALL